MKKVLSLITVTAAIAVLMVSCKSNNATAPAAMFDTTGYAQYQEFQQWKMMNEQKAASPVKTVIIREKAAATTSGTMTSSTTNNAMAPKKKGWSKAAKYATIGAGAGTVTGVLVSKNSKVKGGIIGAVLGGGLGYVIGRSQDKKDGRY